MTEIQGHILVVDDDRLNRLKLGRALEHQGHQVTLAEDGERALVLLRSESIDLVLLDIMMPNIDGYQVLSTMKADVKLRHVPVIVVSAVEEIESAIRCIEMGAEDYLPKPFNAVLLKARLQAGLEKKKLRDLEQAYLQQELILRQSEKLATLGRLSAGMAHELNNPATTVLRGSDQLWRILDQLQKSALNFGEFRLSSEQVAQLQSLASELHERARQPLDLDPLTRSEREDLFQEWLQTLNIEASWELAPPLAALDYEVDELTAMLDFCSEQQMGAAISWLANSYLLYGILEEMGQGAAHITNIVRALKSYTYLDQGPVQNVDVHEGLDNTLVLLRNKLRSGVTVKREYSGDLPRIQAYGSELNQVWTNIIDNAIGAMDGKGNLTIRTCREEQWIRVEIEDDGPGIPEDVLPRIFDPFFTTKQPGEGTGLGLNISHNIVVQKHGGTVTVDSRPRKTSFIVKLPINQINDTTIQKKEELEHG